MKESTLLEPTKLKASDRCDACGARAWVEVVMKSGSLLFCAHHARALRDSYSKTAVAVHDYTDELEA
ncbi:DUF7455 domain-containing protein [Gleimia hominis]|uniref:DUF7455 domain-containing protein n=1 Tax=Gleimia hominis TaxID=595468 RepID=A0ABU3IBI7_9ACTO|nr:hypothetical protein [Gleimia hominis]MDT3767745.1 hypothetical protein [Gleimia hominis]WIK65155.1 hypothetical protein CJ187_003680 [Gleimia hominis]